MSTDFPVVFALYPRVTQLDFTGPFEVFARLPRARCVLASVHGGSIQGDGDITFANVARLGDISGCALLCVPGGFGTVAAMEDQDYLNELRRLAATARYVTSVCTGSLLLAAAGLLAGKRAACHWAWRDSLAAFGVTPDPARVVQDGNVISGGGVTAGIDMALTVMAEVAGAEYAPNRAARDRVRACAAVRFRPPRARASGGGRHRKKTPRRDSRRSRCRGRPRRSGFAPACERFILRSRLNFRMNWSVRPRIEGSNTPAVKGSAGLASSALSLSNLNPAASTSRRTVEGSIRCSVSVTSAGAPLAAR